MDARVRFPAVLLLLALPVAVVGVAHALYAHLARAGVTPTFSPWHHPEALPLALLGVAAFGPLAALGVAGWRWLKLEGQVDALHHAAPVHIIEGEPVSVLVAGGVQLFAAGFREPAIFASPAALGAMTAAELRAAILHERSHILNHDTRFRPVLSALGLAMGWFPHIRRAVSEIVLREECRADAFALGAGSSPAALAGAILAVNRASARSVAGIGDGQVTVRLRRLAEPARDLPGNPGRTLWLAAVAVLSVPAAAHAALACGL